MAVTANQYAPRQGRSGNMIGVAAAAATHFYEGTLCYLDASGNGTDVIDTDVGKFVGMVKQEVDNSSGAAGDKSVKCYTDGTYPLTSSGLVASDVGKTVYGIDNATVSLSGVDHPEVGVIRKVISATKALVEVRGQGLGLMVEAT